MVKISGPHYENTKTFDSEATFFNLLQIFTVQTQQDEFFLTTKKEIIGVALCLFTHIGIGEIPNLISTFIGSYLTCDTRTGQYSVCSAKRKYSQSVFCFYPKEYGTEFYLP